MNSTSMARKPVHISVAGERAVTASVALGKLALLGAAAGLGSGSVDMALRSVPVGVLVGAGTLLLTAPSLVVAHQWLGLDAAPGELVDSLVDGLGRAGTLALGAVPMTLFFSLTSNLWAVCLSLVLAGTGMAVLGQLLSRFWALESGGLMHARMTGLLLVWSGLAVLVASRIALAAAQFVAG